LIHKVGILGGTFDPIHYGHLELAEAAGKIFDLDEIVLIPAAVPPHKRHRQITPFSNRIAMLNLAVQKSTTLHVSRIEQLLPTPSYTIDTLQYIQLHSVENIDFYFITGADAFMDIESWKQYKDVLKISHFIVFTRKGNNEEKLYNFLEQLGYQQNADSWFNKKTKRYVHTSSHSLPSISSSIIRNRIGRGETAAAMLPDEVNQYIVDHELYNK
jgi:nicotinate-nucleotide adenylyltransferase